jgi:hypothetical protein
MIDARDEYGYISGTNRCYMRGLFVRICLRQIGGSFSLVGKGVLMHTKEIYLANIICVILICI